VLMARQCKDYMPTYMLIAVNLAVYVYTSVLSGSFFETSTEVLIQYGQVNFLVLNGWHWQLVTSMFVHLNLLHLLGNMFFLLIFGLRAEEMFSLGEYFAVYFLSGLAGNLLTLLMHPDTISAGASGAIFGLFGAVVMYLRRSFGQSVFGALIYSFFLMFMTSSDPRVNVLAHFGGLAAGLVIGYLLAKSRMKHIVYRYSVTVP